MADDGYVSRDLFRELVEEQERVARYEEALGVADAALERLLYNFDRVLARQPVRDVAETLSEGNRARMAIASVQAQEEV